MGEAGGQEGSAGSAALAAAREHDLAGQHGDAFNVLRSAAGSGDLPAMCELGHRLLVGDRAPKMVDHALALISGAARGGNGRAIARMAALTAAGAYVSQDWPAALRLLGAAAAVGDESARGQLRSLRPTAGVSPDWAALAAEVPVAQWLSPAPVEALHPKVGRVMDLAPATVCEWVIGRAREVGLNRARVYDAVDRREMVHEMRTNTAAEFQYATLDVVQFLVQARMALTCSQRVQQLEAPMILHYATGEQITPHFDFIDPNAPDYAQQIREQGQRMITFLLYLNDEYTGGETTFPTLGIVHRGRRGDGLYFVNSNPDRSSDRAMLHTGSPPTSGEKWIVSQFIRDIALRP